MSSCYAKSVSTKTTPQTQPVRGRTMVKNDGGGYSFLVDCFVELERFLILGSENGTYYVSAEKNTERSVNALEKCVKENGLRTVDLIVDISKRGRAPKNKHAVFALAFVAGTEKGTDIGAYALSKLPEICRYSTDFFQFIDDVTEFRGWGPALRKAASRWYTDKTPLWVAQQVTKYPQRNGRSHRDVLRLSHPVAEGLMNEVFQFVAQRDEWLKSLRGGISDDSTLFLMAVNEIKEATPRRAVQLIHDYQLQREHVPTELLNNKDVWRELMYNLKPWALVRNLGKLTSIGLLGMGSNEAKYVRGILNDPEAIRAARLHPITTLIALKQYSQGCGFKGSLTWQPNSKIKSALETAFYNGFEAVEPTGKTQLLCIDVSYSMSTPASGTNGLLSCCEAATVMAMIAARCEEEAYICGFSRTIKELGITEKDTLAEATRKAMDRNFGGTDASAPVDWAIDKGIKNIDAFAFFTDGCSWGGSEHTFQAINRYRSFANRPTKMVGFQMTASGNSLADPNDAGMLDCVGFDAAAPSICANFIRG